jgi:hypothetical protein
MKDRITALRRRAESYLLPHSQAKTLDPNAEHNIVGSHSGETVNQLHR